MNHMELMLVRPIKQLTESTNKTHLLCIPAYNFTRFVSPTMFAACSQFYEVYLKRNDNLFTTSLCAHCDLEHTTQRFCLPYYHSPYELNFLLDFLERVPQATFSPTLFLSLLRLCDFLLILPILIFDMIQLYVPRHLRHCSPFTEDLVEVLSLTSYSNLGRDFANTYFQHS